MKDSIMKPITAVLLIAVLNFFTACGENSSPEARMNNKLDELQEEMMARMAQQNRAILDSLGKIRQELEALKEIKK